MADIEYLTVEHLSTKDLIRIFSKIFIDPAISWNGTPCWNWTGYTEKKGYGICWHSRHIRIHRLMFVWLIHALPIGQKHGEIDHLCRNKRCCNPVHLDFVPTRINIQRAKALQTHCKHGHFLSGSNIIINKRGHRICQECRRVRSRQKWLKVTGERKHQKNEQLREWRQNNRDHVNAQQLVYASRHKERRATYARRYHAANKETINQRAALYRQINREEINQRQRQWRADHRDEYRAINKKHNDKRNLKEQ